VNDADKGVSDHVVAQLPLNDAGAEALVHELTAGRLAALEVLAHALGRPRARLGRAAVDAELEELGHGVLLGVVVICLHEVEHLVVRARAVAVGAAVLARLELDDPDALA